MRKQTKLVAVLSAAALLAIGASMTSFAAAPHWDREGDEWVYLDRNGDKVTDEWKKSNGQWYYLDSDGYMAKDLVIEDGEYKYYVDGSGAKVSNAWVSMDNDDLLDDEGNVEEIDTVWMYFDSNGKALGCNSTNGQMKQLPYGDGQTGYFIFNQDGYMLSGWQLWSKSGDKDALYYLGSQDEGWAATGWKYLPVDTDVTVFGDIDADDPMYTEESWFYFKTNGKAVVGATETISGKKYAFDEWGRMSDLWVDKWENRASNSIASNSYTNRDGASSASAQGFYREGDGDQVKGDWVQAYVNSDYDSADNDLRWFYVKNNGGLVKAVQGEDGTADRVDDTSKIKDTDAETYSGAVVAKNIKGSTYLFNNKGVMLTGLYELAGVKKGSGDPLNGTYFFSKESGSVNGQMVTNKRVVIEIDGDDEVYYFDNKGKAYESYIINGYVYGKDGQLVTDNGDGSKYEIVKISTVAKVENGKYVLREKSGNKKLEFDTDVDVAINGNGKIRKSGTFKDVDDTKYEAKGYVVTKVPEK